MDRTEWVFGLRSFMWGWIQCLKYNLLCPMYYMASKPRCPILSTPPPMDRAEMVISQLLIKTEPWCLVHMKGLSGFCNLVAMITFPYQSQVQRGEKNNKKWLSIDCQNKGRHHTRSCLKHCFSLRATKNGLRNLCLNHWSKPGFIVRCPFRTWCQSVKV